LQQATLLAVRQAGSAESPAGAQRRTRQKKVGQSPQIVLPDKQIAKSNAIAVRFSRIIDYFYILIDKKNKYYGFRDNRC
jgi:hypothetical protein